MQYSHRSLVDILPLVDRLLVTNNAHRDTMASTVRPRASSLSSSSLSGRLWHHLLPAHCS
ncbi:hypothetical protein AGR1C_pTi0133 [Agrobacterium fabacearum TT111]|nr:hypothetical protein AGR1C_pTi0133 [Agrobacterium fabacearum TT111]